MIELKIKKNLLFLMMNYLCGDSDYFSLSELNTLLEILFLSLYRT